MPHCVFAFGTLKKGFPFHEKGGLSQAEFLGAHRTRACFPLVIAGPRFAPMMFNEPGTGIAYAVNCTALTTGAWKSSID